MNKIWRAVFLHLKFRTCFGENTDNKIFEVGKLLHEHDLEKEVLRYQRIRVPSCQKSPVPEQRFNFNLPEYFESCFRFEARPLLHTPQVQTIKDPKDYRRDRQRFAREVVLWGRKSGAMLNDVVWREAETG